MSHTVKLDLKLKDKSVIIDTCKKLGLPVETDVDIRLFSSTEKGTKVTLPGWRFPLAIHEDGDVVYDIYNGAWGNEEELHKFTAHYGMEKAKLEARRQGFEIYEGQYQTAEDHGLELTINVED
jgi:hypothetical protein